MKKKYFGTDGIRGAVGSATINPDFMMRFGHAIGLVFSSQSKSSRTKVLIGKDTRLSGYMFESAIEAGLAAAGADVVLAGPVPTPAVAQLTRALRLDAGVVITASHNPHHDNGIKLFTSAGGKISDEIELQIENLIDQGLNVAPAEKIGKASRLSDATGRYSEFCKSTFPQELNLKGLKIVVDCGNGASYNVAENVLRELGATVFAVGVTPNGLNINEGCGALHPENLVQNIRKESADFGVTLDGDGDRVLMADADGSIFDGDQLLYIIGKSRLESGNLEGGIVGTQMTNLAIENGFRHLGIPFERSAVGDRYVLEKLQEKNWAIGGEGSGHIVCLDKHTTGDGVVSALQVLAEIQRTGKSMKELLKGVDLFPQVLVNVKLPSKLNASQKEQVREISDKYVDLVGTDYRVLIRESGTEPLLRVMVEGPDLQKTKSFADQAAAEFKSAVVG
jgi:phosphoglucosamine mutase